MLIKEVLKIIGKENKKKFMRWMNGQTVGLTDKNEENYFESDVYAFKQKLDRGYDRQKDIFVWD